ncbi:hypothetical protein [Labrys neptuniae]
MKIDLNDPLSFTLENVAKLIASKDDSIHRQLRVTKAGIAFLSDDIDPASAYNLAFRVEIWNTGNDYTGDKASKDAKWVSRIYKLLKDNWPNPTDTFIHDF